MIGEELGDLPGIGILKFVKQPYQAPWVVAGLGADIRPGYIGVRLGLTRLAKRMQVPEKGNG